MGEARWGGDGAAPPPTTSGAVGHHREKKRPPSSALSPGLKSQLCHLLRHNIEEVSHSETQFLCLKGRGGNNSTFPGVKEISTFSSCFIYLLTVFPILQFSWEFIKIIT